MSELKVIARKLVADIMYDTQAANDLYDSAQRDLEPEQKLQWYHFHKGRVDQVQKSLELINKIERGEL